MVYWSFFFASDGANLEKKKKRRAKIEAVKTLTAPNLQSVSKKLRIWKQVLHFSRNKSFLIASNAFRPDCSVINLRWVRSD